MKVSQARIDGVNVTSVAGRVDHASAEAFKTAMAPALAACRAGECALVLDLGQLDYISSAGLRVLMLAARQVASQGGTLVVAALQPVVRQIFEISRFDLVFRIRDSVADAIATLGAPVQPP